MYTKQEDDYIRTHYASMPMSEMTRVMGRDAQSLWTRASKLQVHRRIRADLPEMQRRLSDLERGYLSGMIDGEGTISIVRDPDPKIKFGISHMLNCTISNTNLEVLQYIRKLCLNQGSISPRKPSSLNGKVGYAYRIPVCVLRNVLPQLQLIIKKEQQKFMLEALQLRGTFKARTQEEFNRLDEIVLEFRRLNKRGIA